MEECETFKELIQLFGDLKREDAFVLFIHGFILDNDFTYKLNKEKECKYNEDKNIQISNGYIKYIPDSTSNNFFISKLLIDPEWKNNSNNYNFLYTNKKSNENATYNLNILKIENSLVIQIINVEKPSNVHSITINMDEYINENNKECVTNKEKINLNIPKLIKLCQTHILFNMQNNDNKQKKKINSLIIETNGHKNNMNNSNLSEQSRVFQNFNDDHFDDKNPIIRQNLIPDFKNGNHILKPDGLFVGPNNKFFNPQNLRYDPIGPFGNEPNADINPFEFQNNFPF
ncbi:conserved Plasmodium protein, unknown function [Plasmodium chabaudi chabaudi]|uniref:PI31 proteasome regulator N-terminal domain-containing protein n=1 Tax=Plasmodium chabaudi chabaudi TaxID=31271 RepID=A0A1D3S018_PLACU|nr:conserved Plasmodium protein, unknown function [Plasmodium chabaudi chabaudi]